MNTTTDKSVLTEAALKDFAEKYAAAQNDAERHLAFRNGVRALRAIDVNSGIADAFETLAKSGPKALDEWMKVLSTSTASKITKQQELEQEREKLLLQLASKPGQSRASMASLFVTIAVIARAFGFEEFADDLEKKAQVEMDKIPGTITVGTNIRNGAAEATSGMADATTMLSGSALVTAAANKAMAEQGRTGQADVIPALNQGSQDPARRTAARQATWESFYQNMKDAGVRESTLKQVQSLFVTQAASYGSPTTLEGIEGESFKRAINAQGKVPQADQDKIKAWIDANVRRDPA